MADSEDRIVLSVGAEPISAGSRIVLSSRHHRTGVST